jgi:predicted phage terminase large subunit-like protein
MIIRPEEYASLLRTDLAAFTQRAFHELNPETPYLHNGHLDAIFAALMKVLRGETRRLIILLPPRSLKSLCVSVAFPAFMLGHNPSMEIICASYGQELADKHARDCRRVIQSIWYQMAFSMRLAERQAVHDFTTTKMGGRMSTSVGGVLTGRGGDLIVIDDPQKPDEALSESSRTVVNGWFDNTLLSRLNDKETDAIIIVMQRLHQDDLVGHVLEQEGWDVLSFPAIAEEDEVHRFQTLPGLREFRRKAGEALHPARESLTTLKQMRASIGAYNFQSQYQQSPIPAAGNLVQREWLRFYDPAHLPHFGRYVLSWDTANKASELADFSVCTVWGEFERRFYLVDVIRERMECPELERRVRAEARKYPGCTILIEDKASGTQLIQDLQADFVYGVSAYKPPPNTDKIMRLHAQTTLFEGGFVLLPQHASWLEEYTAELLGFPNARHDDQVDSTTQALAYMREPDGLDLFLRANAPF